MIRKVEAGTREIRKENGGGGDGGALMKLQGVTISVNYGDFLECVIENRRHFDRWIVVTCADDTRTRAMCAAHGIEYFVSRHLQSDGKDFHAVDAKWHVINEGLDALDQEGWALVLDADVLLPRHFRERIEALPLEPGMLYGSAGRKILDEREAFEQMRPCEPWGTLVARNSNVIGYFNLFSLEAAPNRYKSRELGDRGGSHDDWRFTTSFDDDHRSMVPMTVIHVGWPGVNWSGRRAPEFRRERGAANIQHSTSNTEHPMWRWLAGMRDSDGGGSPVTDHNSPRATAAAAMIGYFPGGRWRELARNCDRVWLVDQFQVHAPSGHPLVEGDRAALRRLFAEETRGMENLELLGVHSVGNLARIPDDSLDLLYLPGEVAPDWLTTALRHWRPKLRDGAVVFGDLFGLPHWREATFSLSLLLGAPDGVEADGFWWKRMRAGDWKLAPLEGLDADLSEADGVVLVNRSAETLEKLLLSLHSVSRLWRGPVAVYHWGDEDPSLTILCGRLGATLWNVGEAPDEETEARAWLEDVAWMQPFRRALILQPGTLAIGPLERAFDEHLPVFLENDAPVLAQRNGAGERKPALHGTRVIDAQSFTGSAEEPPLLDCTGDPAAWSEAAWEAFSMNEAEMAQATAGEVRVTADATIVALVTAEAAGNFQRHWLTWRFPVSTPALVALIGMAVEELWLPGADGNVRVVSLSLEQADDLPWLLRWLAAECTTGRILFLPSNVAALPGSELWLDERWRNLPAVLHWTRAAKDEEGVTGNRFLPEPFFGLIERAALEAVAGTELAAATTLRELPLVMHEALKPADGEVEWQDLGRKGWRRSQSHLYVPSSPRVRKAPDTRVAVQKDGSGRWLLAEDVAVISLPERTDRRQRLRETMELHGVNFRFVDGVRVTDEEIDPEEVAEVHLHSFKLARGPEKFLRGTVGCRRAHLQCLEEAYRAERTSLLLMEDDMQWADGWLERYVAAVNELPRGWLQLYLSYSDYRRSEPVTPNLHRLTGSYQTTAILYSEAGIEACVKALRRSRCEIDVWMGNHLHPFGGSYSIRPGIVFQKGGVSDILSYNRGVTP